MTNKNYGAATEDAIQQVVDACEQHGSRSIVALSGVPGTGKSFIASIAAQRFSDEPLLVREIQFHQSFSYEEFIEGLRIDDKSGKPMNVGRSGFAEPVRMMTFFDKHRIEALLPDAFVLPR